MDNFNTDNIMRVLRGRMAVVTAAAVAVMVILSGCGSKADAPELYDYDDYSQFIKLAEYKGIEYEKVDASVSQDDVDAYIKSAVEETAEDIQQTSGTVQDDSIVNMDYVGSIDGVEFDGGTAQDQELDIANSTYIDGFAEALVGHEVGETFDINVTFPDDYHNSDLAGKDAIFRITLNYLVDTLVPEYNDEWVQNNTEYSTTAEYEESVRSSLQADNDTDAANEERSRVFNEIVEGTEVIEYPDREYTARHDKLVETYKEYAKANNLELGEYLNSAMGMDEDGFEELAKQAAEGTVKEEMILYSIAKIENIEPTESEYNDYLVGLLEDAGYTEDSYKEEKGYTIQEYAEDNNLYAALLYRKVMDKVMEYSIAK